MLDVTLVLCISLPVSMLVRLGQHHACVGRGRVGNREG